MCSPPPPPPPDAPLKPAFDVAYANDWRFSVDGEVPLAIMFINTADVRPVNMSTLELRSLEDDHPTAFVRITTTPSQAAIQPGFAGGKLTPVSEPIFLAGLVSEPRTDQESFYGTIEVLFAPAGTYDIAVEAVLGLDDLDVPLHITVHWESGQLILADPQAAVRTQIFQ